MVTGGGPPMEVDSDPVMAAVAVVLECPWDSTSVFEKTLETSNCKK